MPHWHTTKCCVVPCLCPNIRPHIVGHNPNTPQKFFVSSFEFSTQISESSLHQGKIKSFCFLFCSMSRTPISQTQSDLPVAARRRSLEGRERKPWRLLSRWVGGESLQAAVWYEWVCDLKMLVREVFLASQCSRSGREGMPRPPLASFLCFSDTSQVNLSGSFFLFFPVVSEESRIFKYSFSKLSVLKELQQIHSDWSPGSWEKKEMRKEID